MARRGRPAKPVEHHIVMNNVFAEFEREIIRERIIAGQQRARAQGKRLGRRSVIDEALQTRAARSGGHSLRDIGGRLNVSAATVLKALVDGNSDRNGRRDGSMRS